MSQTIPNNISIKDLLLEVSPKMAQEMIQKSGAQAELAGTEFTLVVDVAGDKAYAYVVKDGKEFDVREGDIEQPLVRIHLTREDLERMIETQNLDMLLGIQNDLSRNKYDVLSRLSGAMVAELEHADGSFFTIRAVFNGSDAPTATFRLSVEDSSALVNKETNPVNLFMSGAMKIEGDMAFAMSTQPLFS